MSDLKAAIRRGWEGTARHYGLDRPQVFQRLADQLIALMDWSPGLRVLDVGTGPGMAAVRAAERVGPHGLAVGVDLAWAMLRRVQRVAVAQMDAERLALADNSFDRLLCAFSLFQFPDMRRALSEMRRVLRPGGQLGMSNWGPGFIEPVAEMQRHLFRQFGLRPLLTNPIAFRADQLRRLLEEAGFVRVALVETATEVWFDGPQAIWEWNLAMGPLPVMLAQQLTTAQRRELARRYRAMLAPLQEEQGIRCTFHSLYAVALCPTA